VITLSVVITYQAAPLAAHRLLLLTTPVSRTPAQSVAMLAGTDGLPPWLDIDRFHVSRHSLAPYPTATVQGAAGLQHLIDGFHHLIKETLKMERLALPAMLPWWRPTFTLQESDRMCEENLPGIRGIRFHCTHSRLPSVDHAYGSLPTHLKGNLLQEGVL